MHHSRLCAVLIDCKTADLDKAARFWAAALGRPVDLGHPMSRDNYRMLETPSDEVIIEIQQVEHESRAHIDIETDDIPAEVRRLEQLGATVVNRLERWVVPSGPPVAHSASVGHVMRRFLLRSFSRLVRVDSCGFETIKHCSNNDAGRL